MRRDEPDRPPLTLLPDAEAAALRVVSGELARQMVERHGLPPDGAITRIPLARVLDLLDREPRT